MPNVRNETCAHIALTRLAAVITAYAGPEKAAELLGTEAGLELLTHAVTLQDGDDPTAALLDAWGTLSESHLAHPNNSRGKKDAGEILEHLVSGDCPVTLLKTTTTQCNHCGAFANQTVHTSVEEYDPSKWRTDLHTQTGVHTHKGSCGSCESATLETTALRPSDQGGNIHLLLLRSTVSQSLPETLRWGTQTATMIVGLVHSGDHWTNTIRLASGAYKWADCVKTAALIPKGIVAYAAYMVNAADALAEAQPATAPNKAATPAPHTPTPAAASKAKAGQPERKTQTAERKTQTAERKTQTAERTTQPAETVKGENRGRTPPSLNNERTDRKILFISNTRDLDAEAISKATGAVHIDHKGKYAFLTMQTAAEATALVKQGRVRIQRASCNVEYAHRPDGRTGPTNHRQDRTHQPRREPGKRAQQQSEQEQQNASTRSTSPMTSSRSTSPTTSTRSASPDTYAASYPPAHHPQWQPPAAQQPQWYSPTQPPQWQPLAQMSPWHVAAQQQQSWQPPVYHQAYPPLGFPMPGAPPPPRQ